MEIRKNKAWQRKLADSGGMRGLGREPVSLRLGLVYTCLLTRCLRSDRHMKTDLHYTTIFRHLTKNNTSILTISGGMQLHL